MTKSDLNLQYSSVNVPSNAKFSSGEVADNSGFKFPEDETDTIVLSSTMKQSLDAALDKSNMKGKGYIIKVTIKDYAPGNAWLRGIGLGRAKLTTESYVYTPGGKLIAKIPVHRSINVGGGFTIGAWRYIFDEVAEEIVRVIKTRLCGVKQG